MIVNRCASDYDTKLVIVKTGEKETTPIIVLYARRGSDSIGRPVYEIIVPDGKTTQRRIAHGIETLDEFIVAVVEGVYGLHNVMHVE